MKNADVKIGDKWMEKDFGFIFNDKFINAPEPKLSLIEIPGTSETIDLTDSLTGDIEYANRELTITLEHDGGKNSYYSKFSELANYIHGQKMKIIFSKDPGFYWIGRVSVLMSEPRFYGSTVMVTALVDPYKYESHSSLDPWSWEEKNAEGVIVREYINLPAPGSLTIIGRRKKVVPNIICSNPMSVRYRGNSYVMQRGDNLNGNIRLGEGNHLLEFLGSGTVSVDYRGGSL